MRNIDKKKLIIKDTIERFKDSTGIIITDYQGLTVAQINELRRRLEKADASYRVIKNTLSKKVLDELNINGSLKSLFTGVTGLVFCKDYVKAVKILAGFGKANEVFKIKGGYIEKRICSKEEIKEISELSSKEELTAKFVILLNSPLQKLVGVMLNPLKNFVYTLKAVADEKR